MAAVSGVIDWDEAMEQCGDDEEFLRELLADLRGETDAQVAKIEETIRVRIYFMFNFTLFSFCPSHGLFVLCAFFSFTMPTLQNPTDAPFHRIMRASHVIKGAASNLMCAQLRAAAMNLEQAASAANDLDPSQAQQVMGNVQARYMDLKRAVENYHAFLSSISV